MAIVELKILNWAKDSYQESFAVFGKIFATGYIKSREKGLKSRFLDIRSYDSSKLRCTGYNTSLQMIWGS